ncbi:MAG: hypothetical protein RBQ71_05025 [Acholeplasmataceae bacterium]|jgi:hypothetical protein|nr:hypothetical protein [Acholeplasmataceae bacterium]
MKKIIFVLMAVLLVAGLSACSSLNQAGVDFSFDNDQEILAFQALSSVQMLDANTVQTVSTLGRTSKMSDEETTSIDQIKPYLELFEQLLTQSNGLSVVIETSDLVEYETKQVFEMTDMLGQTITYTMYYNTTDLVDEDEVDETDESDEVEDDEQEYMISGIMIYSDVTYAIEGKHEIEEDEEKLQFTSKISETDYVTVTYKLEDEETKFAYRVYAQGELVNESNIKIEIEDNEFKIELSYMDGTNEGEYEFKLEEEDGQTILKISFETTIDGVESEGEAKVLVTIDEVTGETYYTIITKGDDDDEEHEERHDRDMDTDNDEDDDDDDDEEEDDEDENDDDEDNQA